MNILLFRLIMILIDKFGNIIRDKSIVEFNYNPNLPINFRWNPFKVRIDKTETIKKYNKNYGNNVITAIIFGKL